ncbi:MAG TPA: hypothetical protein PKZ19_16500, partial [Zoogloea sp.]|nr:hypothetical protein [Zoogloea sp.]
MAALPDARGGLRRAVRGPAAAAGRRTPAECAAAHPEVAEMALLLAAAELARDWRPPQWSAAASH